jgi:acyl-coenzyme A synthetase/AMP-(fatty) acid ligase/aryl carrier-like protein
MVYYSLNPYQLLFFNREINFGNASSNVLKGFAELTAVDFDRLYVSIFKVLEQSEWPYLSVDKDQSSWVINKNWNGRFETYKFVQEIAVDRNLWAVQLIKEEKSQNIRLYLYLHHCLADAHSFNLFWGAVFNQYQKGRFETAPLFPELSYSKGLQHSNQKILRTDLGIGSIRRISVKFNARIKKHLNTIAEQRGSSLMAMLLQYLDDELNTCEKDLEIPLKAGIALRNRRKGHQKNAFPTLVNFLPLSEDKTMTMQQKIMQLFRFQDYPLLDYLRDHSLPLAFNVLFSYQKEAYRVEDDFNSKFTFEASTVDDNIISVHLLEYDDNSLMLHLDYRIDLASETYWKSVLRALTRKIIADTLSMQDKRTVKKAAQLLHDSKDLNDFWQDFDNADPNKTALICNDISWTFAEIMERIEGIEFHSETKLHSLKPERTAENIIELLAAWKNGIAVTYQDINSEGETEKFKTAYVAKSSGTSGEQKTIHISFDALCSLIPDWKRFYETGDSVHLCLADQRFDVFFGDLLRSILSGETMLLTNESERLDAQQIDRLIRKYRVSHFESTPSFLTYLLPVLSDFSGIKAIICGSEPIQTGFYELIQQKKFEKISFFNSYGLTECSIDSAVSVLKADNDGRFPSGFPLGAQSISIRDAEMNLKTMGLWGEICIEGICVGKLSGSDSSNKFFRTGDLGMITEHGLLVNGRINGDFIKINGRRVPSAMIEQLVSSINTVKNCHCMEADNAAVLFVYGTADVQMLKKKLSEILSRYQQPDDYFFCTEWPINQNGKTDRKKLLEWYKQQNKSKKSWLPGTHPPEKILFECLNSRKKSFGESEDTLISFGWNSIELLSLANELNMKGIFVPLASFIQNPTIAFILNADKAQQTTDSTENPTAEAFVVDDILSVLNKDEN